MASSGDTNGKLVYQYRKRIGEKMRHFGDWKYEELLSSEHLLGDSNRMSTASGVSYDVTPKIRVEGAIGLYYTWLPEQDDIFETRLWQAATFDWPEINAKHRRYVLSHRFRVEQRFKDVNGWALDLRGRYRLAFSWPLNRYTVEVGAIYIPVAAEFYSELGSSEDFLGERARYTGGLGYVLDKTWALELRYSLQEIRDNRNANFEVSEQFIELRVKTSFLVRDLLKSR